MGDELGAGVWYESAMGDLQVVERTLPDLIPFAAFHVQQAAEKLLKAALILARTRPKRTHDLAVLRSDLGDAVA